MARTPFLPFERGTTLNSGSYGAVPTNWLGAKFELQDGTELTVYKNTDGAALTGCKAVVFDNNTGSNAVTEASGASEVGNAGVVDYAYSDAGVTVPANALFYAVTGGRGKVLAGAVLAAGDYGYTHGTDGTIQGTADVVAGSFCRVMTASVAAAATADVRMGLAN